MTLRLYNTKGRELQEFTPLDEHEVTLYTCGPTVYNKLHLGNWAAYIYWDTLVRVLNANDYSPNRVMNITDVGHLISDGDEGEDKLEKGAAREGKTAWEVAQIYTDDFFDGMDKLGLKKPDHVIRATEYIDKQLELVRQLKAKGYTYQITGGIYFDTSKFPAYADFAQLNLEAQQAGGRISENPEKRNPSDFALWKFSPADKKRDMEWETPSDLLDSVSTIASERAVESQSDESRTPLADIVTSKESLEDGIVEGHGGDTSKMGFPGWHLECSAIAMNTLGETIDIHTGGIDHIPVHHTNEIAQSEAVTGRTFANFWLHNNHLKIDGTKISKSLENGHTLDDVESRGFSPLDFRMFVLQGHYRTEGNFTFEGLEAAKNRLKHWRDIAARRWQSEASSENDLNLSSSIQKTSELTIDALSDDLNTPEALRCIDQLFSEIENTPVASLNPDSLATFFAQIDELLGLQILDSTPNISPEVRQLVTERDIARGAKNWAKSDELRNQLATHNIVINDSPNGSVWQYIS